MSGTTTMAWKELREILTAEGRPARQMVVAGLFDVVLAILVPLAIGKAMLPAVGLWPTVALVAAGVAAVCGFMGILGPTPTIADAFAGERERHTLETLLAGPLPDGAILRGKMLAQYAVVAAHVAIVSVVAGIASAVLLGPAGLVVLPAGLVAGTLAAAVTSSFIIGLGVLMSLRAPTVKKAQERIGYVMLPFLFIPAFAPSFLRASGAHLGLVAAVAVGLALPLAFVAGAITFNVLAFARFRRDRLVGLG